ncbi:hypothetical protein [Mycobacterium sp. IDR2000157661]|uniref:hypothetical protein n=1 Tax=Mycobacterium sp. IDR2000157661 TaxID=2867005 RepID=UPI001EEBD4E6|nr:hypothetical protein [Mycobacterium sp. IDR2000157661]ULE34105.1 hypothetical protein K3G64_05440 [Mycobacterium sp. IDR2000157661]
MSDTGQRLATLEAGAAQLQHRNVRCAECGAVHWVARAINAMPCGQCGKTMRLTARG